MPAGLPTRPPRPPRAGSDSEDDDKTPAAGPSREDVYSAFHKGTLSSKKRKQARATAGEGASGGVPRLAGWMLWSQQCLAVAGGRCSGSGPGLVLAGVG